MCGIAGFLINSKKDVNEIDSKKIIELMLSTIEHRGPNDKGLWINSNGKVVLGHQRLSILELTKNGSQPMKDSTQNLQIIFNGEIYNHLDLRKSLVNSGHFVSWKGNSDTETLIECIAYFGLEETLLKIEGMFAFALWDEKKSKFFLVRDRFGEKPLYYSYSNDLLIFGSELKALKEFPCFNKEINHDALISLLKHNYIRGPLSIYNNTFKLMPGSVLELDYPSMGLKFFNFWDTKSEINSALKDEIYCSPNLLIDKVHTKLKEVIKKQALADVPVGCFLSGGIDSSLVTAIMQSQTSSKVKTFSIGFENALFDESSYANQISKILGTEHYSYKFTISDAKKLIPNLHKIYDEPFSDSSQLPTLLVSNLASKVVKVCLSGDGGDEMFCGYSRYLKASKFSNYLSLINPGIRKNVLSLYNFVPKYLLPKSLKNNKRLGKLRTLLGSRDFLDVYSLFLLHWHNAEELVTNHNLGKSASPQNDYNLAVILEEIRNSKLLNNFSKAMIFDIYSYLVDDIMVKVDRASMNYSLETRAPFLDHNLARLAFQLPTNLLLKEKKQKYILRQILEEYLPSSLFDRPKMGFGVPLDNWLKGPLKNWANELLDPNLIEKQGFFDAVLINKTWEEYKNGSNNMHLYLWDILMFQSWFVHN